MRELLVSVESLPKKLRFSMQDDLLTLEETLAFNPYENNARWQMVTRKVVNVTGKNFSARAIREHVEHLTRLWKKKDRANLRKSGTDIEYEKKEQLLEEVVALREEFKANSSKRSKSVNCGPTLKDNPCPVIPPQELDETTKLPVSPIKTEVFITEPDINEPSTSVQQNGTTSQSELPSKRQKRKKIDHVDYLQAKLKIDSELREKELALEAKKLELEERRLCLEERKIVLEEERMKLEIKRGKVDQEERIEHFNFQQNLLNILVEKYKNK